MTFGLKSASATFQLLVNTVLAGINNWGAYLDGIVCIYSHGQTSLTLNLAKCDFGKAVIAYLGKQVGWGQVRPLAAKVEAIPNFPVPETQWQLPFFQGMCRYHRGFCKIFAIVVAPLTTLTSPSQNFVWTDERKDSFEAAKMLLCSAPVRVDASMHGACATLIQEGQDGVNHLVCFFFLFSFKKV